MFSRIHITRQETPLKQERWYFDFDEYTCALYLTEYVGEMRKSTRCRKWQRVVYWDRLNRRDSTIKDPPRPRDVDAEAKQQFVEKLVVRTAST